jgi:hypothetical protein
MKHKTKLYAALAGFIAVTGMTSCKKEAAEMPKEDVSINAEKSKGLERTSSVILLSKAGNTKITYLPNNKVSTVDYGNGNVKVYSHSLQFNVITANTYYNQKKVTQATYFMTANGTPSKMSYKAFNSLGNVTIDAEYQFTYTNGKLTEQKGIKGFSDKYLFKYDAKGRLEWLEQYNSYSQLVQRWNYKYGDYIGQAEMTDKNLINPREAFLDDYLKIYGLFSSDLLRIEKWYKGGVLKTNHSFTYLLNNNSYPNQRKEFDVLNNSQLLETIGYDYLVGL